MSLLGLEVVPIGAAALNVWCWSYLGVPYLLESLGSMTSLVRLVVKLFDFLVQLIQGRIIGWVTLDVVLCCGVDPRGVLAAVRLVEACFICAGQGDTVAVFELLAHGPGVMFGFGAREEPGLSSALFCGLQLHQVVLDF